MRTSLISRGVLLVLLSCVTSLCSAQDLQIQIDNTHDDHYINPHITGAGTNQLSYQLSDDQHIKDPALLKQYLEQISGAGTVELYPSHITVTTATNWNNQCIYFVFQGVEIYHLVTGTHAN